MERIGHENTAFFIGPEVEHTPAYSRKTLFVVGKQSLEKIISLAREHKVTHIFMGANHSFVVDPTDGTLYWDNTITALLDRGFWVSLDYPAHQHESVLKILNAGVWQSRMFVPLLRVEIPNVQTSSPNLTVKIDDIGFKSTNPGVWCLHFHEVTDSNRFTDWVEYGSDVVIEEDDDKATPMPPYAPQPQVSTEMRSMRKPIDLSTLQPIEIKALENPDVMAGFVEAGKEMNPQDLGLDVSSPSKLKPEVAEILGKSSTTPVVSAAEAYAEGAKEDPLGKEASKKPAKAKK